MCRVCHGFSLIEVVVALFLVSSGLLGLFSLQTMGLKAQAASSLDAEAQLLSSDLLGRLQSRATPLMEWHWSSDEGCDDCVASGSGMAADLGQWQRQANQSNLSDLSVSVHGVPIFDGALFRYQVVVQWASPMVVARNDLDERCPHQERACLISSAVVPHSVRSSI